MRPEDHCTDKVQRDMAKLIAMAVRNAMEDFHCANLTDAQMNELNPIVRNAIYTVLYACEHHEFEEWCERYLEAQRRLIPGYWEEPKLLDGVRDSRFRQLLDDMESGQDVTNT